MVEKITKITQKIEVTKFVSTCGICGKLIRGSTESHLEYNMKNHKGSKGCKNE